jgi:DNA-binding NarL/FixJ family response regulator
MAPPYNILIADRYMPFRREMRKVLEEMPGMSVVGEAGTRRELFEHLETSLPEMVLLDMAMADLRGDNGSRLLKRNYPGVKVLIMILDEANEYLCRGLAAGAAGVLPKQYAAVQISGAIEAVRQGKIYVPPQASGQTGAVVQRPQGYGRSGTGGIGNYT